MSLDSNMPIGQILNTARLKPFNNEQVESVILHIVNYLFSQGGDLSNEDKIPNWFSSDQLIEGQNLVFESATFLIRLFAYIDKPQTNVYKKCMAYQLRNDPGITVNYQLCMVHARFLYLRNFKPETLRKFFATIFDWERFVLDDKLNEASDSSIAFQDIDRSLYHLCLLDPEFLFSKDEIKGIILPKIGYTDLTFDNLPLPPTIIALTASNDYQQSEWVISVILNKNWKPISFENVYLYLCIIDNVLSLINDIENGNLEPESTWPLREDTETLWNCLAVCLSNMEPSAIRIISDRRPELINQVHRHLCDTKQTFAPLLRCFVALVSVSQTYWSSKDTKIVDERPKMLVRLMDSIFDNSTYRNLLLKPIKFSNNDSNDWSINWWYSFIKNVDQIPQLHEDAIKNLSRRGLEESRRESFGEARYKFAKAILDLYNKCFNLYEGFDSKQQILFDSLRIYSDSVFSIALSDEFENEKWHEARLSARKLLETCLTSDCERVKVRLFEFMKKFKPWKNYTMSKTKGKKILEQPTTDVDVKRVIIATDFWNNIYKIITMTNQKTFGWPLLIKVVTSISHLKPLDETFFNENIIPSRYKSSLLNFRTTYNESLVKILGPFKETITNLTIENVDSDLMYVLGSDGIPEAMIQLLLSPNALLNDAFGTFMTNAVNVDSREEWIRWLLLNYPCSTLRGVIKQCEVFKKASDNLIEATDLGRRLAITVCDELLDIIRSPASGFLLKFENDDNVKQMCTKYWSTLCDTTAILTNCPLKWHKYFDNHFMIEWMRDVISLARKLVSCQRTFEALSTFDTIKIITPLNAVIINAFDWFKATDITIRDFTFGFINETLSVYAKNKLSPTSEVLTKLEKDVTNNKVNLGPLQISKLKQKLSIWIPIEEEDDDVQIIDKKPDIKNIESKPMIGSSSSNGSVTSGYGYTRVAPSINDVLKDRSQKQSQKNPYVNRKPVRPILNGLTTKLKKPYVAPQKLTYGGNKKNESSSEGESEDERSGLGDMERDPENAKETLRRVTQQQRGGIKVLDSGGNKPVSMSSTELKKKDVYNRRLRLDPDISDLHKKLLNVDFNDDNLEVIPGMRAKLKSIPQTFRDMNDYTNIMEPLLMEEASQQLIQAKEQMKMLNEDPVFVEVSGKTFVDDYAEIVFSVKSDAPPNFYLSEIELVTLSQISLNNGVPLIQSKRGNDTTALNENIIAKVQQFKRRAEDLQIITWVPSSRSSPFTDKSKWRLNKFFTLSTLQREYAAIKGLPYYGLNHSLLRPRLKNKIPLDHGEVTRTMSTLELNKSQAEAVLCSLKSPADGNFSLIQGPPGTGKSKTILALVAKFMSTRAVPIDSRVNDDSDKNKKVFPKILICAPSNAAIDEVVNRLKIPIRGAKGEMLNVNVIRIGADSSMNVSVKERSLEELVDQKVNAEQPGNEDSTQTNLLRAQLASIIARIKEEYSIVNSDNKEDVHKVENSRNKIRELKTERVNIGLKLDALRDSQKNVSKARDASRRTHKRALLMEADVICSTLSGAGKGDLSELPIDFETVIIDEAAQAVEISALIPLKFGCKRPILIGDPHQLPPTVISTKAESCNYSQSLFVRLMKDNEHAVHLLNVQYRMHPDISILPSKLFYQSALVDGKKMDVKTQVPWHYNAKFGAYKFFDLRFSHEEKKNKSYYNYNEIEMAASLYKRLIRQYGDLFSFDYRVAIVTMYKEQVFALRRYFRNNLGNEAASKIDINTVDGFQGQEKSVIILSTVRSSPNIETIGFLRDARRMNVALTRAQSSLFIIGSASTLSRADKNWDIIINDAKERGLLESIDKKYFERSDDKDVQPKPKKEPVNEKLQAPQPQPPTINDNLIAVGKNNSPNKRKNDGESLHEAAKRMRLKTEPEEETLLTDSSNVRMNSSEESDQLGTPTPDQGIMSPDPQALSTNSPRQQAKFPVKKVPKKDPKSSLFLPKKQPRKN